MDRIIGVGSPHGDDQAGWQVAEMLRQRREVTVDAPAADFDGYGCVDQPFQQVSVIGCTASP
jgi:Ni,Fe-hydrogenase maturation factor